MKKLYILIIFLQTSHLMAQKYSDEVSNKYYPSANQLNYTIYSGDYLAAKAKLVTLIKAKKFFVINQNVSSSSHHFEFKADENDLPGIDSFCNLVGYVSSKNLNSYNNEIKLSEAKLELEKLNHKLSEYEKMLIKIDSVKSNRYYQHWEKIRDIEAEIYNTKLRMGQLESVKNIYSVKIDLMEEASVASDSKIHYIHMPGVEYATFFTENPTPGISYSGYSGYLLKYLFTRGKDYFSIGALKADKPEMKDSMAYGEIFTFAFGQDWYSKHFKRGKRKFINPYIGYESGFAFAYKKEATKFMPFVSPGAGIELFKNKLVMIDINANYFLPINNLNHELRGWKTGLSINVSF